MQNANCMTLPLWIMLHATLPNTMRTMACVLCEQRLTRSKGLLGSFQVELLLRWHNGIFGTMVCTLAQEKKKREACEDTPSQRLMIPTHTSTHEGKETCGMGWEIMGN